MTSSPSSPAELSTLSPREAGSIKKVSVGWEPSHIRADWSTVDIRPFYQDVFIRYCGKQ
jgi:hypothetical protein